MDNEINLLVSTSKSALLFDDQDAATELLSALKSYTSTRYAQLYDANGAVFAEYKRHLTKAINMVRMKVSQKYPLNRARLVAHAGKIAHAIGA
ncbi:hypothetical protein N9N07_02895 [Pseudomonadales bacterium]|nr:hypothetical protein [Pseudomonadales bacterium]